MQGKTEVAGAMDITEKQEKYDSCVKKLLSQKVILAWILKSCVSEFSPYSIGQIMEQCIEAEPQVSVAAVHQDELSPEIIGNNTENSSVEEGTVVFDILFHAVVPGTDEPVQLIINIEGQRNKVDYPLVKRAIYYASRLVSSQKNTVFVKSHYEKIRKVYSIWIILNAEGDEANSVTGYSFAEKNIFGKHREPVGNYDLISIILVGLGNEDAEDFGENSILRLLDTLFSTKKETEEKKDILETEFGIPMFYDVESEVGEVGGLGKALYEDAARKTRKSTRIDAILSMVSELNISVDRAMQVLRISDEEKNEYRSAVEAQLAVS